MNLQIFDHEEILIQEIKAGAPVSIEAALLTLSGLKTDNEKDSYGSKLDDMFDRFRNKYPHLMKSIHSKSPSYLHLSIAQSLFYYLWNSKPKRFGKYFLLTDVIDAQLDSNVRNPVGTCVGLTSLYSVLGLRAGLDLSLLVSLNHLLSRLTFADQKIDIDQTDPQGFNCQVYEGFREFPILTLISNVLNSRGLMKEEQGCFDDALADYQKAISINPEYANPWNNRGNMRLLNEDINGAIADYSAAIKLNTYFCEAYCNRGIARQRLGQYDKARQDYYMALEMNPEYSDAGKCLALLNKIDQPFTHTRKSFSQA